jgi:putative inorganic carbon (HCO3(-)) transporter
MWIGSVLLLLYAIALTGSRGGLIALGAGIATLLMMGRRRRISIPLIALAALVLLPMLPSRQTDIEIGEDTSLSRIKIWSDGLQLIRESPVLGVGFGRFGDEVGMVAHNSFLHCFAELGVFGGMMFLGAFVQAIWGLSRLRHLGNDGDATWRGMGPYLMAMTVAATVGMLSLSRSYIVTTYTLLGCVAAFQLMAPAGTKGALRLNVGFIHRSILASTGFILSIWLLVRVTVHWR